MGPLSLAAEPEHKYFRFTIFVLDHLFTSSSLLLILQPHLAFFFDASIFLQSLLGATPPPPPNYKHLIYIHLYPESEWKLRMTQKK